MTCHFVSMISLVKLDFVQQNWIFSCSVIKMIYYNNPCSFVGVCYQYIFYLSGDFSLFLTSETILDGFRHLQSMPSDPKFDWGGFQIAVFNDVGNSMLDLMLEKKSCVPFLIIRKGKLIFWRNFDYVFAIRWTFFHFHHWASLWATYAASWDPQKPWDIAWLEKGK